MPDYKLKSSLCVITSYSIHYTKLYEVVTLLRHCLDRFVGEISPDARKFGEFKVSAAVLLVSGLISLIMWFLRK